MGVPGQGSPNCCLPTCSWQCCLPPHRADSWRREVGSRQRDDQEEEGEEEGEEDREGDVDGQEDRESLP